MKKYKTPLIIFVLILCMTCSCTLPFFGGSNNDEDSDVPVQGTTPGQGEDTMLDPDQSEEDQTHQVVFVDYDGTILKKETVKTGAAATPPETSPWREGYAFVGWDRDLQFVTEYLIVTAIYERVPVQNAIVFVLDDSSSMIPGAYNSSQYDKFTAAKESLSHVIAQISDRGAVGIVTFHDTATKQADMTQLSDANRAQIIECIESLDAKDNFGTNYQSGLHIAFEMLVGYDAPNKHIIFLTDGYPTSGNHEALPTLFKNNGISLSTVAMMTDDVAAKTIGQMAVDGGGINLSADTSEELEAFSSTMENLLIQLEIIENDTRS